MAELDIAMQQAQLQVQAQLQQAQIEVNKVEAASTDRFSSRWRPFVGWVCASGLVYSVVAFPLFTWASINFGWRTPPVLDTSVLTTMLGGLLGIAGMRTYEKVNGVAK